MDKWNKERKRFLAEIRSIEHLLKIPERRQRDRFSEVTSIFQHIAACARGRMVTSIDITEGSPMRAIMGVFKRDVSKAQWILQVGTMVIVLALSNSERNKLNAHFHVKGEPLQFRKRYGLSIIDFAREITEMLEEAKTS